MSYEHIHRKMGSAVMLQVYPLQQNLLITAITQIPELNPKQSIISAGGAWIPEWSGIQQKRTCSSLWGSAPEGGSQVTELVHCCSLYRFLRQISRISATMNEMLED